jgi:hypothetical protein
MGKNRKAIAPQMMPAIEKPLPADFGAGGTFITGGAGIAPLTVVPQLLQKLEFSLFCVPHF